MPVEPYRLSATDIVARIRDGQLSVEDYAKSLLARIKERDPIVRGWAYINPDQVILEAQKLDQVPIEKRGPLHGVAIAVKDVIYTKDMPTQFNSPIYEGDAPQVDAASIIVLRKAGALILGKTTTTEFAATTRGPETTNPHDSSRTPGGSSSGSGAVVADFQAPISLGTQTGGSVIRPASFNGVYGFKPTWNSISREGQKVFSLILDTIGFYARDVADLNLLADVFALEDDQPPDSEYAIRNGKFAFCKTMVWPEAGPGLVKVMDKAVELLRSSGATVVEIEFPEHLQDLPKWHSIIFNSDGRTSFLPEYRFDKSQIADQLIGHVENHSKISRAAQVKAFDDIASARPVVDAMLARYDAVLTPSVPDEAPEGIDSTGSAAFNKIWTALHNPIINIPGFTASSLETPGLANKFVIPPSEGFPPLGIKRIPQSLHTPRLSSYNINIMSRIPITYCGAHPDLCSRIAELIASRYDVVHIANTGATAIEELPALLQGKAIKPASGLGSQSGAALVAAVVGGAFTNEDLEAVKAACDPVKPLPWFKKIPVGLGAPPAEVLAEGIQKKLDEEFKSEGPKPATPIALRALCLRAHGNSAEHFTNIAKSRSLRSLVREITIDTYIGPEYKYHSNEDYEFPQRFFNVLPYLRCFGRLTRLHLRYSEFCGMDDRRWMVSVEETWPFRYRVLDTISYCVTGMWTKAKQIDIDRTASIWGFIPDYADDSPEIFSGQAMSIKELTISNLADYKDPCLISSEAWQRLLTLPSLIDLKFLITTETYHDSMAHESVLLEEKYEFFESLPCTWLSPSLAGHLRVLSLYYTNYWGWFPRMDLDRIGSLPLLKVLALGKYVFCSESQLDWFASIGRSNGSGGLEELYLDECPILFKACQIGPLESDGYPNVRTVIDGYRNWNTVTTEYAIRWHHILGKWTTTMKGLRKFTMGRGEWLSSHSARKAAMREEEYKGLGMSELEQRVHHNIHRNFTRPEPLEFRSKKEIIPADKYLHGAGILQNRSARMSYIAYDIGTCPWLWHFPYERRGRVVKKEGWAPERDTIARDDAAYDSLIAATRARA
ncbi:hypothetical protein FSARC_71 [Fusarium sarcochroum]|uniref:Amidase domain-containing protein n=1 Tax=Fusarium sarcochroum TaxID=1208366 RepID=A0A8H4XFX1_9HYPO|nr:hypothetical protein FSARC_71 [Fusarium sarcochroum]